MEPLLLVLLVGEELSNHREIRELLAREGIRALETTSGSNALALVEAERPAVVLVCHHLPDGDGVQLLKQIREQHPWCEVVLVTSGGDMDAAIEVLRAGALDYLRWPVDVAELQVALGRAAERRRVNAADRPPVVLVMEDHEPTLRRLVDILEKEGLRAHGARNGEEGMLLFERMRVDVMLLDLKMPRKGGLEVLRETKGRGADVEVIVTTGYGDEDSVVEALRGGAVNFLRKPIDIEQMLLAIERAIEFQTARRSLLYRNRDLELMRQLVVRLTEELESLVKGSEPVSGEAASFLQTLVHALPFGIVVADANRRVLFANRQGLGSSNETPVISLADWLRREGATAVGAVAVDEAFARLVQAKPGAVETQDLSEDTHLIMTSLNRPAGDDSAPFFLLAVGCNRRGSGAR